MTKFNLDEFNLARNRMAGDINRAIADAEESHKTAVATADRKASLLPAAVESVPPGVADDQPAGKCA